MAARAEIERRIEALHERVQDGLYWSLEPLDKLLDDAMELVTLVSSPDGSGSSSRLCAFNDLLSVWEAIDHPGYASEIARTCQELLPEVATGSGCLNCLRDMLAGALVTSGRLEEADVLCSSIVASLPSGHGHRAAALGHAALVAEARGDVSRMRLLVNRIRLEGAPQCVATRARLVELETRTLIAEGRLDQAVRVADAVAPIGVDLSPEGMRALLHCARALGEAGRWVEAAARAHRCAQAGRARQASRLEAEALLVLVRAARASGDDDGVRLGLERFAEIVRGLRSRDLDEEGRALAKVV